MYQSYKLKQIHDERGELAIFELADKLEKGCKRVYYIKGVESDIARGAHAHKALKQIALCLQGSCTLSFDDGVSTDEVKLEADGTAVSIEPWVWHGMHAFSQDAILLVLADDAYDESDYIRSYQQFLQLTGKSE